MNPILMDIPEVLETERLILSMPRMGDGRMVYEAIVESLVELRQWMDWAQTSPSINDSESHSRQAIARFINREELSYNIFRREGHYFVGRTSLHTINWYIPKFEIGYWLRTSMVGYGYMTEAVKALTDMTFEQLEAVRVEIRCDARNQRSASVAMRAGYRLEATLKQHRRDVIGELSDTLVFARLPSKQPQ